MLRDTQIHRMNFLRQGRIGLVYKHLLYGLAIWVGLLAVIYGIQFMVFWGERSEMKKLKSEIASLTQEKERQAEQVKMMSRKRLGISAEANITSIIAMRPRWSHVIREFARALPADVWLNSIQVIGGGEEWYKLLIKGEAKSQRVLTNFIMKLESNGMFTQTALDKTEQAGGGLISYQMSTQPVMKRLVQDD